jgi:hypothetical protein
VRRGTGALAIATGIFAAGVLATGCSSTTTPAKASCGTTRTGANVAVNIKVAKGDVSCQTAMSVENAYAADIKKGDLKGTGGGAPIEVDGWSCEGYATPQVLKTGDASECHSGNSEIAAELASDDDGADGASTSS